MEVRNLRPFAVEIVDPATDGATYECAARPGVVEVPDKLGRSLLKQEDAWAAVDDEKPKRGRAADEGEKV